MNARGDIESVNLGTGERYQRVVGDGESRLVKSGDKCADCGYSRHTHEVVKEVGGRDEWHGLCKEFREPLTDADMECFECGQRPSNKTANCEVCNPVLKGI